MCAQITKAEAPRYFKGPEWQQHPNYVKAPKISKAEVEKFLTKKEKNFVNDFGKVYVEWMFALNPDISKLDLDDQTIDALVAESTWHIKKVVNEYDSKIYKSKKIHLSTDTLNEASKAVFNKTLEDICREALAHADKDALANPENLKTVSSSFYEDEMKKEKDAIREYIQITVTEQQKTREGRRIMPILEVERKNALKFLPTSTPPAGYYVYKSSKFKRFAKGENVTENRIIYRNRNGHLLALRKIDENNFVWGQQPYQIDSYTGDTILKYDNFYPLSMKLLVGEDTIYVNGQKIDSEGNINKGKTYKWFLSPKKINIHTQIISESTNDCLSLNEIWEDAIQGNDIKAQYSFCKYMLPKDITFPKQLKGNSKGFKYGEASKGFKYGEEIPIFWNNEGEILLPIKYEKGVYHLKPKDKSYYYLVSFPYNENFKYWDGIQKYLQFTNLAQGFTSYIITSYISFPGSDEIKLYEEHDKYVKINLNGVDTLQVLKRTGEVFGGTLTRPSFKATFNREHRGTITLLTDTVVPIRILGNALAQGGNVTVPAGSTYNGKVDEELFFAPDALYFLARRGGDIYNPAGEKEFTIEQGYVKWLKMNEIIAKQEAEKAAESKRDKEAIYLAYCAKYGKAMIDELLKGKLPIGTPETLLKEVYDCELRTDSRIYRQYHVILDSPTYDLKNRTISSRGATHFGWGSINAIAGVKNGKVVSVTILK